MVGQVLGQGHSLASVGSWAGDVRDARPGISSISDHVVWDWGAYVDRLEAGWLKSEEANAPGVDDGTPADWATQTHQAAQTVGTCCPKTSCNPKRKADTLQKPLPFGPAAGARAYR